MPRMRKLVTVDLFAGLGGISLGLIATRLFEVVVLTDRDNVAADAFEHNFPPDDPRSPRYICKPIEGLAPEEITEAARGRAVDVIVGGVPCQGFSQSMAGKRTYEDERNHLFKKYFEIVAALRPKALILENVPEFLILFEGRIFKEVRDHLKELGYRCAVDIVNAARYGVPQSRQRVIIVAIAEKLKVQPRLPDPTHGGSAKNLFNYVTRGRVKAASEMLYDPANYEPMYGDDVMGSAAIISAWRSRHLLNPNGYSGDHTALARYPCQGRSNRGRRRCLSPLVTVEDALSDLPALEPGEEAGGYTRAPLTGYQRARRALSTRLANHRAWRHTDSIIEMLEYVPEGGSIADVPEELRPRNWYSQAYARLHRRALARTITTFFHNPGSGRFTHYNQTRTLTPREAARLQSIDDRIEFSCPPSHQERLIGNAVPPLLAQAIGRQLYRDLCEALASR